MCYSARKSVCHAVLDNAGELALCVLIIFRRDVFLGILKPLWFSVIVNFINRNFVELLLCLNWVEILFLCDGCIVAILITSFLLSSLLLAELFFPRKVGLSREVVAEHRC